MMNEWIISSSILIVAVLLGRLLLRGKISLRLQYALWAVALIRLLLPIQIFTSDFGAGSIARDVDISAPVRQVYTAANEERYEREYDAAYQQVVARYEASSQRMDPIVIEQEAAELAKTSMELDLDQLLYHVWFGGMVVMASVIVSCNVHLSIQLKRRRWELEVPDSLLPVYITEAVPTPCIFGFFKPAIYLTPGAAKDPQVRTHVLEHELTHYRHWDHVWSVLRSLCLVLHWYNPLVWIAAKVSRADAELACDEGALARLGEGERGDYGRTLIGLTCSAPISDLLLTATTMTGSAGSLRERIKLLMKRPRNTVLTLTAAVLMITLIVGCTFAGAPETTQPTETTEPTGNGQLDQTDQYYALAMEQAMADYADKNPRRLTAEEIIQARDGLASTIYDEAKDEYSVTAVAAFFTSYYDDVRELDFAEFLRYFPTSGEATEEEFQLLREKYGADFDWSEHPTLQTMPVPVHRYEISHIDEVLRKYANLPFQELEDKESVYYLEETGCYYNFTSDFGPGMFTCVDGFVYDGGAILYSESAALFLTEAAGHYSITAHLSVIERSNNTPGLVDANGLLVFPGTEWGMTEGQVVRALNIGEYGIFSGMRGIHLSDTEFFGYPASIAFYFDRYRDTDEWGLCDVRVQLANEEDANAVYNILYVQLRESDFATSGVTSFIWQSDIKLKDLVSPNAYAVYQERNEENILTGDAASTITWFGTGNQGMENVIWFSSGLSMAWQIEAAIAPDQATEVAALFDTNAGPWYLAALAAPYADYQSFDAATFFAAEHTLVTLTDAEKATITEAYGKDALDKIIFRMTEEQMDELLGRYVGMMVWDVDLSAFLFCPETQSYLLVREEVLKLRIPEIIFCEQLKENQVRMIYRFPGEDQRYCATLLKGENWKVYSNHMLLYKPLKARALTEEEVAMVRAGFSPDIYDAATDTYYANPLACFTHTMYEDITEMNRSDFLAYFPPTEEATQEEFEMLKAKYPDFFEGWTWDAMPLPVHRYDPDDLDEIMMTYAGIRWDDLGEDPRLHYLEETGCYYNYTSDFGLLGFPCTGGWVYDGGAMLYTDFQPSSVLVLTERNGQYYIQAHLPAIVAEN